MYPTGFDNYKSASVKTWMSRYPGTATAMTYNKTLDKLDICIKNETKQKSEPVARKMDVSSNQSFWTHAWSLSEVTSFSLAEAEASRLCVRTASVLAGACKDELYNSTRINIFDSGLWALDAYQREGNWKIMWNKMLSMTWAPMARLPGHMHLGIFLRILILSWKCMLCILIIIASSRRF